MKQEQEAFEEWAVQLVQVEGKPYAESYPIEKRDNGRYSHPFTMCAWEAWQASRAEFKAKLLSDEMVEAVADAIDAEEHKNDCDKYPLAKRINLYGKDSQYEIFNKAKAALEAIAGVI